MSNAKIDDNREPTGLVVDTDGNPANLKVDPTTGRLLIEITAVGDEARTLNTNKIDENSEPTSMAVTDDANTTPTPLHIDNELGYLFIDLLEE